ncbi:MAG: TonB-dependent receptor [Bacteroidales bacterium]|nr:TonB-dependent receptor [Bacteroidales bacterium]
MKVNNNILRVSWLCTCLLLLFSAPLRAQKDNRLTLELNQASLAEFVKAVEGATDYTFIYSEDVKLAEPITMSVRNATLKNVLNTAFEGQPVKFEIEDHHILLMRQRAQIRNVVLSGRVTDASTGEPLVGVSIYNPQRRTGTTTDANGYYNLTQPNNVDFELVFSYVGYASKTHQLKLYGNRRLDVALVPGTTLQEVEVYGTRHNFGVQSSQMSTIAMSVEQIRKMPALLGEVDVLKSLQKLPGVQSAGDGKSGIYVRGGDYDQNLFLMDGITLYNPEHLQGFTSAYNADVMDEVVLYKGAFPARYGNRLSSVIDVSLQDGDMEKYHASLTAGMLASRVQVDGPIWKGHTSFNIAARASYFKAIVKPLLAEVIYDNPGQMNDYSHMRYWDMNAKLVHKFSEKDKLTAIFYMGNDKNNDKPNTTNQHLEKIQPIKHEDWESDEEKKKNPTLFTNTSTTSRRIDQWNNILGGLNYTHQFSPDFQLDARLGYSGYDYQLGYDDLIITKKGLDFGGHGEDGAELYSYSEEDSSSKYFSKIRDWQASLGINYKWQDKHDFYVGIQGNRIELLPRLGREFSTYIKCAKSYEIVKNIGLGDERYTEERTSSAGYGSLEYVPITTIAAYVEDDWSITSFLKVHAGLRLSSYQSDGETKLTLEPRASMRVLFNERTSLKASFTRMSQGIFQLTSSALTKPASIWIPFTKDMDLGRSDQLSLGISHNMKNGIELSVEGYYKWLDGAVDYKDGYLNSNDNDWRNIVAQGKGRAFGVEFLAQKTIGNTQGLVSYTWSKSLRTFDRPGMELDSGREFFAPGDRRHNFNITITQRLSKNWDFVGAWTYQSGRRANLATITTTGYTMGEYDDTAHHYNEDTYVDRLVRFKTYPIRNSYTLPASHRLDVGLSHHGSVGIGEMICDITIYNLYNQQNVSSVYWGFNNNVPALKAVCMFPIMPSISLTLNL